MALETEDPSKEWQNVALGHHLTQTIELYETEFKRWLAGEVSNPVFTEFRLRHGVYGQRQNGVQMIRIKLPLGMTSFRQLELLADLSEELADGVCHVTTRQDFQYHNVHINNTPELMWRLADHGITTIEACGNVVRNVCACTKSGACATEAFDTTPHALAMADFLLGHPEAQDFGRKFKIAYSGCSGEMCGVAKIHDLGLIAITREVNGNQEQGFQVYIGGGLGAVPRQARLLYEFISTTDIFTLAQAISRIFIRHGERKNRNKARFKFVVDKFGIDEIRRQLEAEIEKIPQEDPFREALIAKYSHYSEVPLKQPSALNLSAQDTDFQRWYQTNVENQKEKGYSLVHIFLPLGDISASNLRKLVTFARRYLKDSIRLSIEQNLVLRWVSDGDLPELYKALKTLHLHERANTLADVTACPGSDSCKLGIASSRGLAAVLNERLRSDLVDLGDRQDMKIKISGCPNSCGQHHIADIGFFGSAQSKQGKMAPVFQLVLGGATQGNAQSYGLAIGKISPHNVPEALQRIEQFYLNENQGREVFSDFVERVGKKRIKDELEDLMALPSYEDHPEFYSDSRSPKTYKVETGQGECAGELVPRTEFILDECDRQNAQSVLLLGEGRLPEAFELSISSINKSVKALLLTQGYEEFGDYHSVQVFKEKFVDPGIFSVKCFGYLESAQTSIYEQLSQNEIRYHVEQATLFVEEANVVYTKIAQTVAAA
ncbi:nitrite/sulfite reductase [Deltaproteobacteria bacterium TL4]